MPVILRTTPHTPPAMVGLTRWLNSPTTVPSGESLTAPTSMISCTSPPTRRSLGTVVNSRSMTTLQTYALCILSSPRLDYELRIEGRVDINSGGRAGDVLARLVQRTVGSLHQPRATD